MLLHRAVFLRGRVWSALRTVCSDLGAVCSQQPEFGERSTVPALLQRQGASLVRQHPWLLAGETVARKLQLIGEDCSWTPSEESLAVLSLPDTLVAYVARRLGPRPWHLVSQRVTFLSNELGISRLEVLAIFRRHICLLTQDVSRLERILSLLREGQVPREAILRDLWVFRHNEALMSSRLQRALRAGLLPVRPWMLRCPEEIFEAHLRRWEARADALRPHADTLAYLAERLRCSHSQVRFLAQKNPRLLTINAPKLQRLLDFLFANGYGPAQVSLFPRVLSCSLGRLQRRLAALREHAGNAQPPLHLMAATEKEFDRAYRRMARDADQLRPAG